MFDWWVESAEQVEFESEQAGLSWWWFVVEPAVAFEPAEGNCKYLPTILSFLLLPAFELPKICFDI